MNDESEDFIDSNDNDDDDDELQPELTGCLTWNESSLQNYKYYRGFN